MLPYIIVFTISTILAYISEKVIFKNKGIGILLLILSMLPLTILAGLRTVDMGWDVKKYGISIFNILPYLNFNNIFNYISHRNIESGFIIYMFSLGKIYYNINFVLFGLNAIVSYSLLYLIYKNRNKCSIAISMIMYETVLYSITFSTLRQCISLGFLFILCIKFLDKKYISSIILFILALLFHNSALFILVFIFIILINDSKYLSAKAKRFINILGVSIALVLIFSYDPIIRLLWNMGIIGNKYVSYLDSRFNNSVVDIRWAFLFFKLFNVVLSLAYYQSKKVTPEEKNENRKWHVMLFYDFVITLLSTKFVGAYRVGYYLFFPALFMYVPQIFKMFKGDSKNQVFVKVLFSMVYLAYFILSVKFYDIYPYRSIIG